ncbi:DUF5993 family protein [Phycisphaerales bacterium]|nr:DUF5993 family protein [Phycisphaerales bacterium]
MIGSFIFILILLTVFTLRRKNPRLTLVLFGVSTVCVALLFLHHATDQLGLSF